MMLKQYLLSVVAASFLMSFTVAVLPKGKLQKTASLIGSLLLILSVLSPVVKLKAEELAIAISDLKIETEEIRINTELTSRELQRMLIKEEFEAYIWDKASAMGVSLDVEILLSDEASYPHPVGVKLEGSVTPEVQASLSRMISDNLGIEFDKQEWIAP